MSRYVIEFRLLWIRHELVSGIKVTQSSVGIVFLGTWLIAVAMLAVFGSPALRAGPYPLFLITVIAACFAVIPIGILFTVASLSTLWFPSTDEKSAGASRAAEVYVVSLNRLLVVIAFLLVMASFSDIRRSSTVAVRQDSSVRVDELTRDFGVSGAFVGISTGNQMGVGVGAAVGGVVGGAVGISACPAGGG